MSKAHVAKSVRRACGGILQMEAEGRITGSDAEKIKKCEQVVGQCYTSEKERQKMVYALKLSLMNQKEHPFRAFEIPVSANAFSREKTKFLLAMEREFFGKKGGHQL